MKSDFLVAMIYFALHSSVLLAKPGTGALPRGKVIEAQKNPVSKDQDESRKTCFTELLNPAGGNGFITADGKETYLLAKTGSINSKKILFSKYSVFKIDTEAYTASPVVGLKQARDASLITLGSPVDTISAIAIRGKSSGCFTGKVSMVTISISSKSQKPTFVTFKGVRGLIRSTEGYLLSDLNKHVILEFDKKSVQTRNAATFAKGQTPLWYIPTDRQGVLLQRGKITGIRKFHNTRMEESLKLKEGQKIVQQNEFFGIVNLDSKANTFEIEEIKGWSGERATASYKIKIPAAYSIDSAAMTIDFTNQIAVVYGLNFLARQRWQRVFVFSYSKSEKPIQVVAVKGNNYFNYIGINPQGKKVLIEQADTTTRVSKLIKVYDFDKNHIKDIIFPEPHKAK